MKIVQFSINDIINNTVDGPYYFEQKVNISELAERDSNDIRQIDIVNLNGFVTVDKKEIIFSLSITGTMILPCARTLVDVPYHFEIDATEIFSAAEQLELNDKESEIHLVSGDIIDLTPYIKENILLDMPYRVFSNEKGLEQGDGWELYEEEEFEQIESDAVDPRMAKLQQLLEQKDDNKKR